MKIALLAPFEEPVPPLKYGGIELVVYNLAEELHRKGHDVTLFASGDSHTSAKLEECVPKAIRTLNVAKNNKTRVALNYQGLAKAIEIINKEKFDIVHNHLGWPLLLFMHTLNCPVITTLHGTLADPTERLMYDKYRDSAYVSISDSQRRHGPNLNYVATVHNGIDTDAFSFSNKPGDYLAFLGRISPEKGPGYAIEIARKTGQRLIMAAKIDPVDISYFEETVEPLIDGDLVSFLGEVGHEAKVKLLKNAKALLSPLQWDEPFGLANVEAMACGTPVIAINRGSMPEVILNGKTGYLCSNIDEMIDRVADIDKISRQACRAHVEDSFSSKLMAERYLKTYAKFIK
ncbi:MAG TPA: glycosyltransferase family 4 protein [Candidatus Saccharimonadales bacterium]|nr:glycosyltransferase family 4 protein [Candidatus Saccharimonadales bacterium]